MIGRRLGHYKVIERIGGDGMSVVFRARDERLHRDVALKILPEGSLGDADARRRAQREAVALSQLNHPNIEIIHDVGRTDDVDFIVMEYIPGFSLGELIAEGPLTPPVVMTLGLQLAQGLAAAHERGIVHRDLKPNNLRITTDGRLKILDFDLARMLMPTGQSMISTTSHVEKGVTGTLPYLAPEILHGQKGDVVSDLYAAGAVLYEMATGRRAFVGQVPAPLMYAILNLPPPPPRDINREVPTGLESIILRALEKKPGERYQSATELIADLQREQERVARAAAATAGPPNMWRQALTSLGLAMLIVLGLATALVFPGCRERLRDLLTALAPR